MTLKIDLIPVRLGNGAVLFHTRAEYAALMRGVEREIVQDAMSSTPLREDEDDD